MDNNIYEPAKIKPIRDLEEGGTAQPTGVPVTLFILVAAVTVAVATFVINIGVGWNAAVGTQYLVSTKTSTKN